MKHILLTSISPLICATALFGQITITNNDMPDAGDTLRYSVSEAPQGFDYQTSGANHTWNFSNLIPVSQGLEAYKAPININPAYYLFFGITSYGRKIADSLNLGVVQLEDIYDFHKNSTSKFVITGRGFEFQGIPTPVNYQDEDEIYQFPLSYSDYDSSTFRVEQTLTGLGSLTTFGSRVNDVDGWGSVTTPFGTFNVLRVLTTIYQTDSIYITQFNFGLAFPRIIREYKWLANGAETPILQVTTNEVFGNEVLTEIRYKDVYQNLGLLYAPVADFVADDTTVLDVQVVNMTNLTNYYPQNNFQWIFSPNGATYTGGTSQFSENPSLYLAAPNVYTVTLKVSNIYGQDSITKLSYIYVYSTVGVEENTSAEPRVFPVPALDYMQIIWNGGTPENAEITDINGRVVKTLTGAQLTSVPVYDIPAGPYFIRWYKEGKTGSIRFLKSE